MIEAGKAAVMVVKGAENPVDAARPVHITPRTGSQALIGKQQTNTKNCLQDNEKAPEGK